MPGELGYVAGWQEGCMGYRDALVSRHERAECPYTEGAVSNQGHLLFKRRCVELEAGVRPSAV